MAVAQQQKVTQRQVAERLGISPFVVSHALRQTSRVSPSTRRRVQRMAEKLGYRVNVSAQAMATGRFGAAGLLLHGDAGPDLLEVIKGAGHELTQHGMRLCVDQIWEKTLDDPRRGPRLMRHLAVDGLIIDYDREVPDRVVTRLHETGTPVIWVNTNQPNDTVLFADLQVGHDVTAYLLGLGHQRIALLDSSPDRKHALAEDADRRVWHLPHHSHPRRIAGYRQAMAAAGLDPRVERLAPKQRAAGDGTADLERAAQIRDLLGRPDRPTAVITIGATDASDVLASAWSSQLRVPGDLSVLAIGADPDTLPLRMAAVPVPRYEAGRAAVQMLLEKIEDPGRPLPAATVDYRFAPPPADAAPPSWTAGPPC